MPLNLFSVNVSARHITLRDIKVEVIYVGHSFMQKLDKIIFMMSKN